MTSQWRHRNKTHSWNSELNSLQNVYFELFYIFELSEWRCFVTYLSNDPRTNNKKSYVPYDTTRLALQCDKSWLSHELSQRQVTGTVELPKYGNKEWWVCAAQCSMFHIGAGLVQHRRLRPLRAPIRHPQELVSWCFTVLSAQIGYIMP